MSLFKSFYRTTRTVLLFCLLSLALFFTLPLLPTKDNFGIFSVQSGSMEPEIKTGAVILTKEFSSYEIGDVVTRISPENHNQMITHRIIEKEVYANKPSFRTQGDNNQKPDKETFFKKDVVGKVVFSIPYLGFPLSFVKTFQGFILLVVIPATILIYEELKKIKKELAIGIRKILKKGDIN